MPAAIPVPAPFHHRLRPGVGLREVPQDQRHQGYVDLAEIQRTQHRLGPQHGRPGEQRGAQPHPGVPVAQRPEGDPEGRQQQHDVHRHGQRLQRRPRDERHHRERDRCERRVSEQQAVRALPAVQRRGQVRVVHRLHVPDDKPAGLVHMQVNQVKHPPQRMDGDVGEVACQRRGERYDPGQQDGRGPRGRSGPGRRACDYLSHTPTILARARLRGRPVKVADAVRVYQRAGPAAPPIRFRESRRARTPSRFRGLRGRAS